MAYIQIDHRWPDGENITITVGSDASRGYPDELAELEARAMSMHRELVVETAPETEQP